jgi:HEAT repeat protein
MGRTRRLEDRLAALEEVRLAPTSEQNLRVLQKALTTKTNHVVGRAAEIAGDYQLLSLELHLVTAFDRFMVNAPKTDPGCVAKAAIVDALYRMEAHQPDVYLKGIGHVQLEAVWGGKEDTAAGLRGASALALVRINYPNVMLQLAQLLADPESDARIAAARAIGYAGNTEAGEPLLRYKALVGDEHPQVLCDCFGALLQLTPEASLSFVASFLQRDDVAVAEAAAVALGESQLVQAFPFLETAWEDAIGTEMRQTLLLAIALLRHERPLNFLLGLLAKPGSTADHAFAALRMYRSEARIWRRVEEALREYERLDLLE